MSNLLERIKDEIEAKAMKFGIMGTEQVSITLELSEDEKEEFSKLNFNNHYSYELEGNVLFISYTETIKTNRDNRKWIKVFPRNFNNEYFYVGFTKNSTVQKENFMNRVNNEPNSSAHTCRKAKVEKIEEFKEITNCEVLKGIYTLYGSDFDVIKFLDIK